LAQIELENVHDPYPFQFQGTQSGNDLQYLDTLLSKLGQPFHLSLPFGILPGIQNDREVWTHYDFFCKDDSYGNAITPHSGGVLDPLRNKTVNSYIMKLSRP
jgi:hypothetical protein